MKKLICLLGIVFLLGFLGACKETVPTMSDIESDIGTCEPTQVQIKIDFVDEGIEWGGERWSSYFMVTARLRDVDTGYQHLGPYPYFSSYNVEPGTIISNDLWAPTIMDGRPMVKCGIHKVVFELKSVLPSEAVSYGGFSIPRHPLTDLYPEYISAPYCQIRIKIIKPAYPYKVEPREYDFGRFQWGPDDVGTEKTFTFEITL